MYKKIRKHYIFNMFKNITELFSKVKGLLFFVFVFCDLLFHVWLRRQSNMAFINKEEYMTANAANKSGQTCLQTSVEQHDRRGILFRETVYNYYANLSYWFVG